MLPRHSFVAAALAASIAVGCSAGAGSGSSEPGSSTDDQTSASGLTRDFSSHPAIIEIDDADHVYALSDAHGGYETLLAVLAANHLIAGPDADPTKVKWTGGTATLIIAGDLIDKGSKSLEVIDLVRSLETQAPHGGGRVIATMGNHEAEFLLDPMNHKAMSTGPDAVGIDNELSARGIDPQKVAAGKDAEGRGKWLAALPLGVRVKKWFFAHGGNTQQMSIKDLKKKLENSIANNGFGDKDITGKGSILEAQEWYGDYNDSKAGKKEADALGVDHIVFGHDPGAFKEHGKLRQSKNGVLVKIDVAMGLHEGSGSGVTPGAILHITTRGQDTVEILDEHGRASALGNAP
jgi:hypothetical protein